MLPETNATENINFMPDSRSCGSSSECSGGYAHALSCLKLDGWRDLTGTIFVEGQGKPQTANQRRKARTAAAVERALTDLLLNFCSYDTTAGSTTTAPCTAEMLISSCMMTARCSLPRIRTGECSNHAHRWRRLVRPYHRRSGSQGSFRSTASTPCFSRLHLARSRKHSWRKDRLWGRTGGRK